MRWLFVAGLVMGSTCFWGCGRAGAPSRADSAPDLTRKTEKTEIESAPSRDAAALPHVQVEEQSVVLNDGAGILNGDFDVWLDEEPLHWEVLRGREGRVQRFADDEPGRGGVLMTGPGYTYNHIRQRVEAAGPLSGTTIAFSVNVKCYEPETAKIMVGLGERRKFYSGNHSGSGEWERLEVSARVPKDFAEDRFEVGLAHYGSPKKPCLFDAACIEAR
ncbi:MAG TPA: hypothetical protein HPP77_02845 [Candidatus Hydrogenedentes bacterium]|nr:hypothetical protein [Candidatus Hydrogenedentota bacterium]HIJ74782.1 hypothetical protein [Candidatus Hydrogenedentota bacterium]